PQDVSVRPSPSAALSGARDVFDQHDANPELAATNRGGRRIGVVLVRLTKALERASYRAAAAVIVPNDSYAHLAVGRGGVARADVEIVRNAPPARFRELADGLEPEPGGPFRIGYLGVMGSQDGVEILLDAVAELRARQPALNVRVDLVGDGEARTRLERRASGLGLSDHLVFHGYL